MKKLTNLYRFLAALSGGKIGITVMSLLLPAVIMMIFGVVLAFQHGHALTLSIIITASTLIVAIPLWWAARKNSAEQHSETESQELEQSTSNAQQDSSTATDNQATLNPEWSLQEVEIWQGANRRAHVLLEQPLSWNDIDTAAIQVLDNVAQAFGKSTLDFSIPEGLKLFEEISRRYRIVVKEHVPAIELMKISHIKSGIEAYDKYGELGQALVKTAIWANHAKNLYFNPAKVLADLGKQQATSSMTKGLVEQMQYQAKLVLLQEVAAVAIDLYSGRFSLDDDLQSPSINQSDEQQQAIELTPTRIVIVGQTSCGKSSLVNALNAGFVAEVDALPSTDATTVYQTVVNDVPVKLIDGQGLDGSEQSFKQTLNQVTHADLVIWVVKANQSARALDNQLKQQIDAYYVANLSRKKPRIVLVVNQVDRLAPVDEWTPPYNLEHPDSAKAQTIVDALSFNQQLLHPDISLALSIAPERAHMGVEQLREVLLDELETAANVQRNRARNEAIERGTSLGKQMSRVGKLTGKAVKKGAPKLAEAAVKKILK